MLTSDGSGLVGIDPATNEVATEFELPARCSDVALGDDALWLPCDVDDRVLKVDPETGDVLLESDAGAAPDGGVALDADSVWVRSGDEFLVRLDRETGERVQEITATDLTSGGDLLVLDGEVWTTAYDDQLLFRIDGSAE